MSKLLVVALKVTAGGLCKNRENNGVVPLKSLSMPWLPSSMSHYLQAQRVLNVVKKEVDRWKRSGEESELKHKQVCLDPCAFCFR